MKKKIEYLVEQLLESYYNQNDDIFLSKLYQLLDSHPETNLNFMQFETMFNSFKNKREVFYSPSSAKINDNNLAYSPNLNRTKKVNIDNLKDDTKSYDRLQLTKSVQKAVKAVELDFVNRKKFRNLGLPISNTVLLVGPPGGGKTSLAYKIAHDIGREPIYVNISEIISSSLGDTGKNISKVFQNLNSDRDILLLDEFDAIASSRENKNDLAEMGRAVNVLLQSMDSVDDNFFLIAATNFPEKIDKAIMRRFSKIIKLEKPDDKQRQEYIELLMNKYNIETSKKEIELASLLSIDKNYADLKNIVSNFIKYIFLSEDSKNSSHLYTISEYFLDVLLVQNGHGIDENNELLIQIVNQGYPITKLSKLLGIPRTTLSYRLKRGLNNDKL
ncbi:AAA family ATPase [Leuconostoc citreum]|uniref:AAA family ATPase n=1 Tax=Leuconostoc citreum TaxID=33964 RepID=UPI0011BB7D42|nr:AAA family ATPase [Leuconostoc citreum]QEA37461.1 AAA family ATPase [Leuconostoc citreum]